MKTRVLIVDDEEQFVNTVAERLKMRDYDVTVSLSGQGCIDTVKELNFDVVVLDVQMPGIDGIETLRQIKSLKPLIEVIMLTGHATVETAIEGMRLGAFDFLLKPCETEALIVKIDNAYSRKADHQERIREAMVSDIISSPRSVLK